MSTIGSELDGTVAAEGARERLLTGLPVSERRLDLADIPTVVLRGSRGRYGSEPPRPAAPRR